MTLVVNKAQSSELDMATKSFTVLTPAGWRQLLQEVVADKAFWKRINCKRMRPVIVPVETAKLHNNLFSQELSVYNASMTTDDILSFTKREAVYDYLIAKTQLAIASSLFKKCLPGVFWLSIEISKSYDIVWNAYRKDPHIEQKKLNKLSETTQ